MSLNFDIFHVGGANGHIGPAQNILKHKNKDDKMNLYLFEANLEGEDKDYSDIEEFVKKKF